MKRILVAGIGNIFLGDDGFGVTVAQALANKSQPHGVDVIDFGIRGVDLTFKLMDGYDAAILIDTAQRGGPPGSLYVIEPAEAERVEPQTILSNAHAVHPANALALVKAMGGKLSALRLVACEPKSISEDEPDLTVGLSPEVAAAVSPAMDLVEEILSELREGDVTNA